jgi:hypothetical protein
MSSKYRFLEILGFTSLILVAGCGGGSGSNSTQATALNLTSISPTSIMAGGSTLTLFVSGSNFSSESVVQWNGTVLDTTFDNTQNLSATVPASDLAASAIDAVTVFNPGVDGGTSNSAVFQVDNPIPQMFSLSPTTATLGSLAATINVTGNNFTPNSQIEWNGAALATSYVSATQITAQVPAVDLSTYNFAQVSVFNPPPGGGSTGYEMFQVVSGATRILTVSTNANDIAWDPIHQLIYASLPSADGVTGNSVVAINPVTGTLGTAQSVSSNPNLLSVSSDASYLWVGLDGSNSVQRLSIPNLIPDIKFPIPASPSLGSSQTALSLEAAPGSPRTVALIMGNSSVPNTPDTGGEHIYDDATQRPTNIFGFPSGMAWLQWGADGSTLFGSGDGTSSGALNLMNVSSSGVSLGTSYTLTFPSYPLSFHFDSKTGYLYGDDGVVADPASGNIIASFNLNNLARIGNTSPLCAVDSSLGIVFFLGASYASPGYTIQAFDQATYRLLNSLSLPQVTGDAVRFLRWGNAGLAFNTLIPEVSPFTPGSIYIVDGSFVNSSLSPDTSSGTGVEVVPAITSISPQTVTVGVAGVTLNVTGANFVPGMNVYLGSTALNTTYVNSSQLQATVPASLLTAPGSSSVTVSGGISAIQSLNALAFTVAPAGSGLNAINLAALDVAWDPNSLLLYLPVSSADTQYPNSVVALDPTTGLVTKSQFVGADPDILRTSADGKYLYTGFELHNFATQVAMPGLNSPLSWSLGSDSLNGNYTVLDIQPAPSASQTTAIALASPYTSPTAEAGVQIYDNNILRPTQAKGFEYFGGLYDTLQWGANNSTLYAANNESTGDDLYVLNVNSAGVQLAHDFPNLIHDFYASIHYDNGTGYIYDDSGEVINPSTGTFLGRYGPAGLMAPDSSLNRVFMLGQTAAQFNTASYTIESYNQQSFAPVRSITLSNIAGSPLRLVRWGSNGLVLVTDSAASSPGMLYIINNPSFVNANERDARSETEPEPLHPSWQRSPLPDTLRRAHVMQSLLEGLPSSSH